jgi:hypothetical protein
MRSLAGIGTGRDCSVRRRSPSLPLPYPVLENSSRMVAGDGARACRGGPEPLRRAPSACHPSDARPVRRRLLPGGRRSHPDALATTAVLTIRAAADAVVGPGQRRSRARTEAQQKEC